MANQLVKTTVGWMFFELDNKHLAKKLFDKNIWKISYGCFKYMFIMINNHNILKVQR